MPTRALHFLAIVLGALALVPAGAHLLELPNKITLPQADYFIVQGLYRGWWLTGFVLIAATLVDLVLALHLRRRRAIAGPAGAAFLLLAATLAIFFTWTFPANQATRNWTVVAENWQALRLRWEFAHASGAILTFVALCAAVLSALMQPGRPAPR
jgi:hypothetical protein